MDIRQNDRLNFDVPTVLFGASPIGPSVLEIAQKFESWPVLAADGGVNAAINAGLLPQMVIGDMDSVTELDQLPVSVQQIRLSGQDDTDFEKCLRLINAPLIVGIGFLDGQTAAIATSQNTSRKPIISVASLSHPGWRCPVIKWMHPCAQRDANAR